MTDVFTRFEAYLDVIHNDLVLALRINSYEDRQELSKYIETKERWPLSNALTADYLVLNRHGFMLMEYMEFCKRYTRISDNGKKDKQGQGPHSQLDFYS